MYRIKLSNRATKDADRLPHTVWQRILAALETLVENPRLHGSAKIKGEKNLYRLRVGDYRILYDVDDSADAVLLLRIQSRQDAYRDL